jgi:hypothetical protein
MLIYFLQWWPSWISDRQKKPKLCRGPSNDPSWAVWFKLSKWFQRGSILRDHWKVFYKVSVFYSDQKSKMATITGHRLTLDPMGKCSNAFSETTNPNESKLDRNDDHSWAV